MNNIRVTIGDTDYTSYVVSPLKMGNLLDERLDEVNLTLRYISEPYFEPQTLVKIYITNNPEAHYNAEMADDILKESDYNFSNGVSSDGHLKHILDSSRIKQTYTKYFIVASDNASEIIPGSGRFEHEIYLIERTKLLEGFICDSLTFTNPNGLVYDEPKSLFFAWYDNDKNMSYTMISGTEFFKSPAQGNRFQIWGLNVNNGVQPIFATTLFQEIKANYKTSRLYYPEKIVDDYFEPAVSHTGDVLQEIIVKYNGAEFYRGTVTLDLGGEYAQFHVVEVLNGTTVTDRTGDTGTTVLLQNRFLNNLNTGFYEVSYMFWGMDRTETHADKIVAQDIYVIVPTIGNVQSPKKWTISDVVDRICDTLEPNRATNRFSFDETQKAKYDKILAPEFTFTKMTVREMLRTVGGFIHAEPRLKDDTDSNVFVFDEYGSNEKSHISKKSYVSYQLKSDINEWCTALDSSAENLVNQLDYAQGVSYEPTRRYSPSETYGNPDITLRSENATARFSEDESSFIPTSLPIYKIKRVRVVRFNNTNYDIDITPYVYEEADYGLLKSNKGYYPNAKAFAVYYRQGEKNIKGLFYKEEDSVSQYFSKFAIVNIIRAASGDFSIDIVGEDLYKIGFSIEYTPIYSTRIRTIKQTISTGKTPRALAYNQGENLIETRYYGENLKGVVARLGNIEKTYTYHLAFLSDIPKVGTLFDDNYYISSVYTEILQSVIKCTVGLSKEFNRLSQYVGISSNKRMWEVSEKQSQARQSIYTEYMKVSMTDNAGSDSGVCFVQNNPFFLSKNNSVTLSSITTKTKNKTILKNVLLPSVASAIGNSMIFTFSFEDNYSAGQRQLVSTNESGNNIFYSQYVPYCDYFGKFYYMDIDFTVAINASSNWGGMYIPERVYGVQYYPAVSIRDWKYRKDNREIPQITYELSAVSDDEEIIIGSGIMQNNLLVNISPLPLVLYGFTERLNKINSEVDFTNARKLSDLSEIDFQDNGTGWKVVLNIPTSAADCVSFAIVTQPSEKVIEVTDDDGNNTTQTIKSGGLLYIGINKEYNRIKDNNTIYLSIRKEI